MLLEGEPLELCSKIGNLSKLSYVELYGTAFLFAMSLNKVLKLVWSPTRDNNTGSSLDTTGGKCFPNATCRADDQYFLVGPRHSVMRVPCRELRFQEKLNIMVGGSSKINHHQSKKSGKQQPKQSYDNVLKLVIAKQSWELKFSSFFKYNNNRA